MVKITTAAQLLAALKEVEASPERRDLELLTLMLSEVSSGLVGLSHFQVGLMQTEPQFLQAQESYNRLYRELEHEMAVSGLDLDGNPPRDMLTPLYQRIRGT